ncbi:DUF2207 domain-containing protein [Candidatus Gottesmanbacteria bacterium]|nr:DUF2207 domain-containing protein [Candidatus Gottesmanbacteria bacterium]
MLKLVQHDIQVSAQEISLPIQGEHIQNFDTTITVNKDGTIDIKEKIVYDFATLQRYGIYRDIPYVKTNKDGKRFRLDFSKISVTDENLQPYQYKKIDENQKLRLKIGDPDRTITGIHTYIIIYTVSGALTYFSDHDELYWNVTGNDWTVPISNSTAQIILSENTTFDAIAPKVVTKCYTGFSGSTDENCTVQVDADSIEIKPTGLLNSNEGLTVAFSFPKNIVAVLEPKPYVTFWETIFGKFVIGLIISTLVFWYVIYPIWIPIKWLRQGRDPQPVGTGEARAWFDPPKSKSGRVLTPEETGALVDEKVDMEDISGMIVYLAQKGHFEIVEDKKNDFYFQKKKEYRQDSSLLDFEKLFLTELFVETSLVRFKDKSPDLYKTVEDAKKLIYKRLVTEGFFPEDPNKIRTFYTVIGGLALTTFNFALAFSAFFFGRNMPKKTLLGVEAGSVAKSLRNFLSSQDRRIEFLAKSDLPAGRQVFFEKLLPYAIVFGVEKIWAERFKDIQIRPPDWYQGYSSVGFNSIYLTNSLNSSFSSFQSAATPVTSSSGFSSGSSGGSSGGGGGGGGGGSW